MKNDIMTDFDRKLIITLTKMFCCAVVFVLSFIVFISYFVTPEREAREQKETAEWAAQGCPVYKSQCGSSKHKYECERRGVVVGRNQVGDIFVNAYPICKG